MKKNVFLISRFLVITIFNFQTIFTSQDWSDSAPTSSSTINNDSNGWSDSPPGGDTNNGDSVATLIAAPTTSTSSNIITVSDPTTNISTANLTGPANHPFAELYSGLTHLQGALLESINVYWNATKNPQTVSSCSFSTLPSSTNSIMQGQMGPYFGAAFMPGSLPLQIIGVIQKTLIAYVQGMTKILTTETYAASIGNDFINFTEPQLNGNPGTFTGNLAYMDSIWTNTYNTVNSAFLKLKNGNTLNNGTIKFIENILATINDSYMRARYQTIITWYTHLVKELSQRYNPTNFNKGLFNYRIIPNSSALTGYSNAFIDACRQLTEYYNTLSTSATFTNDTLSLAINQQVTPSDTVFTNPQNFFTTIQNTTFNRLGDICTYLSLLGLRRACDRIQNKKIPATIPAPIITFNNLQDVPTFLTSTQTGGVSPVPFFPGTQLPTSPDFYCAQQLFSNFSGYVTSAIDSFNFNPPESEALFVYDSLSPLIVETYEAHGLNAPSDMLQDLQSHITQHDTTLQKLEKRITESTSTKVAIATDPQNIITTDFNNIGNVFQELIVACNGALDAQYWYTQSNNAIAAAGYSTKAALLQKIISAWKNACTLMSKVQAEPSSQSYQIYSQAGDLFYASASELLTLNLLPLNTYALTLGAYIKTTSYQALLDYYASYYKESLSTYNTYLQTPPAYSYANGQYNFDIAPGYEKALFMIVYSIDQALSTAMTGYQNQLSFFLSQKNDPSYLSLIWPIQDALLLLTNFQEAITPLLLETPCATTGDKKALICGVDYNLMQTTATNVAEKDIAALIIKAHNQYTATYPLFRKIDRIMEKHQPSSPEYIALQKYTSLDSIFQLSSHKLNFSNFFLLHQARLYTSVAQRLITGKPFFWEQGDPIKTQGSPYALLLYGYAAAIYKHLGYTKHTETVNAMKHLLFSPSLITSFKTTIKSILKESITDKKSQEVYQMYQELNALYTILYLSPGDTTQFDFLKMLSPKITQHSTPSFESFESSGYADWLATNPKDIDNASLEAALMYYQGYLIAQERKDVHAAAFFKKAQDSFTYFIQMIDTALTNHVATLKEKSKNTSSSQYYESDLTEAPAISEQLEHIKKLVSIKDVYSHALYQMDFLESLFTNNSNNAKLALPKTISAICSQFLKGDLNLPGIIGDVYLSLGDQRLLKIQSSISTTLNLNLAEDFRTLIEHYTEAKNFYAIATITDSSYQQKFLEAEYALSNAYAYQSYTSIVPLFNVTIPSLSMPQKSSFSIPAITLPTVTLDQAVQLHTYGAPLFLLRQRTTSVPALIAQPFQQDSNDAAILLKGIASPLYSFNLLSQVQDKTPKTTLQNYIDQYNTNYKLLCTSGITVANQTLHGSISYKAKDSALQLSYEPLPCLPRFNAEINSALGYYADECAKLYATSNSPLNYHGKLLIPSNNLAGQDLANKAMLNTYISRAVELKSIIMKLKQDKKFIFLQQASVADRAKQNFYNYLPLYKELQTPYEEIIGLYKATNSLLSNYGMSTSACSEIIAQTIIEWMKTNALFVCGIPDMTAYGAILHNLLQGTAHIQSYANQTAHTDEYISQAIMIFTGAYEYCAEAFAITPDTLPTTINPDSGNNYPTVPTFLPPYMRWKDAGTYYTYAGNFIGQIINESSTFSSAIKNTLLQKASYYYEKAIKNFLQYSTFNAALFCSNAFQEFSCTINNGVFNTVELQNAGDPAYPTWDYPLTGLIPQVKPPTYYTYPVCQADPTQGSSYIVSMPPSLYQGVASMEVPLFAMCKNQSSQGQQSQYSTMYTTMQQIMLNALYYYEESLSLMKKLVPTTKVSKEARDAREKQKTNKITAWIIAALNKNPGFYNPYTKEGAGLPTIMIQTTSDKKVTINGKESNTIAVVNLIACADIPISLANPQQLYLHTLRYWSSRSDFYSTLLKGLLKWSKPNNYDIAENFLTDVITMFKSFFIHSYMPTANASDAQYQIQGMIQNSQQDNSKVSAGYF